MHIKHLLDILFTNIFSHSTACLFHLLMISFSVQNFIAFNLFIFAVVSLAWRDRYQKKKVSKIFVKDFTAYVFF